MCQRWARFQARQNYLHSHVRSAIVRRCVVSSFRAWYWYRHNQLVKFHVSRVVVNGCASAQRRRQHAAFDGWLSTASRTKTVEKGKESSFDWLAILSGVLCCHGGLSHAACLLSDASARALVATQLRRHCRTLLALVLAILEHQAWRIYCHLAYTAHQRRRVARLLCFSLRF